MLKSLFSEERIMNNEGIALRDKFSRRPMVVPTIKHFIKGFLKSTAPGCTSTIHFSLFIIYFIKTTF